MLFSPAAFNLSFLANKLFVNELLVCMGSKVMILHLADRIKKGEGKLLLSLQNNYLDGFLKESIFYQKFLRFKSSKQPIT